MKITIDCSKAINEKAGIARYTWEITQGLVSLYPKDHFFLFFNFMRDKEEKNKLISKFIGGAKNVSYKTYLLPGGIKEKLFASRFSILNHWIKGNDLHHATEFLSFDRGLKMPQVLTVHDLTMIKFPDHRGQKECFRHGKMLESACQRADAIISMSEATKNDIIKYFSLEPNKITTIYQSYDQKFKLIIDKKKINQILKKYQITLPYILFVGTIEPRKNISTLLKAFDDFSKTNFGSKYQLILIGRKGWNTGEIENTYQKTAHRQKIKFLDFVQDEDLVYLYNGASLFCYPSLYEGFGLPPLEAMACGVSVITSNISSLPEVVGDAGQLIDPNNYQEISQAMNRVLSNEKVRQSMIAKGLKRAEQFSWQKSARQTHQVYEQTLEAQ